MSEKPSKNASDVINDLKDQINETCKTFIKNNPDQKVVEQCNIWTDSLSEFQKRVKDIEQNFEKIKK